MMVALDCSTGETIWKTPSPTSMQHKGHQGAGYSSPVVSRAARVTQYVQAFGGGVIGVAAADGALLWGYSRVANQTAVIPTPLVYGNYVFASSGYGAGAALLKIVRTASGIKPEEVYFYRGNKVQNHHGGMVLMDGHVYMGHGHNKGLPLCLDLISGTVKWGPVRGPGSGSAGIAYADGHLYFRYENARMALVEATPSGYRLKSEFRIPSNLGKSWPHPAIARKRLYLRDQDVLLCYDLAQTRKGIP
jgi:outer membrane protein assembly factor BamB